VSKTKLKLLLWAILLLMALAGLWLVISGIGSLVVTFQQGANPASALNIVPNVPPDLHVDMAWLPDDPDTGRPMEPFTRSQIESAYLRAWLQWNLSHIKGEPYGLKTYFVGPALASVSSAVAEVAAQGWQAQQVDLAHRLQLHFYAADGSIVSFTDHGAEVVYGVRDDAGGPETVHVLPSTYDVVMFLEDGTWRVRHMVRRETGPFESSPEARSAVGPGFASRSGRQLVVDGVPFHVTGVNYYPQATPWDRFWPHYDPEVVDQDFGLIHSLGLNTVRIFIPFEQFGGPGLDPAMLDRLDDLLRRAEAHSLKVIVTLFDFRTDYNLLLWPEADRHLETLLTRFADHPAILAWDLKNEADLDFTQAGRETVLAWLEHMARLARRYDPNHLLTVGWSSSEAAVELVDVLDFVSFHDYLPPEGLAGRYEALREAVGDLPIVLGEFGLPTWNSFLFPNGHSEAEQASYYANILTALREADSAGYLAWTLHDFDHVPASVAGRLPWRTGPQGHLGVIRIDGQLKPAAFLLAPDAAIDVPRLAWWARFTKPFWLTMFAGGIAVVLLGTWIVRRMRKEGA
jgi:hypothetical protein